jgi:hypothetical protein
MKHAYCIRFEALESRQLLSRAHLPLVHAARVAATPVVLDGTLIVDNKRNAVTSTMNPDGSSTTSDAVAGQLGALGTVHGVWYENQDAFGQYQGPDTLHLRDSKGTMTIEFNNLNPSVKRARAQGPVAYVHTQRLYGGTGAYARASESGTIEVTMNAAGTEVVSLTLHTKNT